MKVKVANVIIVFCAVANSVISENYGRPYMEEYTRIKRGKYYPPSLYGPPRAYSRIVPDYSRRPKVSKRPTNDGWDDEDINSFIKKLSKQDLDKIVQIVGKKDQDSMSNSKGYDNYNRPMNDFKTHTYSYDEETEGSKVITEADDNLFKSLVQEIDTDIKYSNSHQPKPFVIEYNEPTQPTVSFITPPTPTEAYFNNYQRNTNLYNTEALAAEENMLRKQIEQLQSQINDGVVYTDSEIMPEEDLPKPINLREKQDNEVSYTNDVPTVVKADNSYKLENFGKLPVMNHDAKLDTLSSYHVPHYTVTSTQPYSPAPYYPPPHLSLPPTNNVPSVEAAPPPSEAKANSDAHLKAVRIWSHKSKGTAYTLHEDGSLSIEWPEKPKKQYGPY